MAPKSHFGQWLKKVRERLGLTQKTFAAALGLESAVTVHLTEKGADRSMRGTTTEALLDVLGYPDEEELDAAWRSGTMPDLELVKRRLREAQALARGEELGGRFDADLLARVFHWLAAHPTRQARELLRAVPKNEAAAVARALVERVAEDDGGSQGNHRG